MITHCIPTRLQVKPFHPVYYCNLTSSAVSSCLILRVTSVSSSPPSWTRMCPLSPEKQANDLVQCLQWYGLSPVCVRVWLRNVTACVKLLLQCRHRYGFSPVWILVWVRRFEYWVKALSQYWHRYGLSPVCVRMWSRRCDDFPNDFSQCVHWKRFGAGRFPSSPDSIAAWEWAVRDDNRRPYGTSSGENRRSGKNHRYKPG